MTRRIPVGLLLLLVVAILSVSLYSRQGEANNSHHTAYDYGWTGSPVPVVTEDPEVITDGTVDEPITELPATGAGTTAHYRGKLVLADPAP